MVAWKPRRERTERSSSSSSCWDHSLSRRCLFLSPSLTSPFPAPYSRHSLAASLASRSESTGRVTVSALPLWISPSSPWSALLLRSVSVLYPILHFSVQSWLLLGLLSLRTSALFCRFLNFLLASCSRCLLCVRDTEPLPWALPRYHCDIGDCKHGVLVSQSWPLQHL